MSNFRSCLVQVTESISVFTGTFKTIYQGIDAVQKAIPAMTATLSSIGQAAPVASAGLIGTGAAATTASVGVQALQLACGPAGIALAAIGAGLAAFATSGNKSVETNQKISDSFAEIERRALAAGDKIRDLSDALKYGAFAEKESPLEAAQKQIDEAQQNFNKAVGGKTGTLADKSVDYYQQEGWSIDQIADFGKVGASKDEIEKINDATSQYKAALDEYDSVAEKLMQSIREEQTTEEEKANALKTEYQKLLEKAKTDADRDAINKKIASIDQGIADAKAKELADQEKRLADQRAALEKELGISLDFTPAKSQEDALADDLAKLRDAFKETPDIFGGLEDALSNPPDVYGGLEDALSNPPDVYGGLEDALTEAENRIRQMYSDETLASFSESLKDVDSLDSLDALTAELEKKLEQGLLTQDAYNTATADAATKHQELIDAQIAAIPGLKELLDANDAAKNAVDAHAVAVKEAEKYLESDPFADMPTFSDDQIDLLKNNPGGLLDDAASEYASAMQTASEALEKGVIDRKTYDELVSQANSNLAKATDDAAKKLRDDARAELGIDAIMESLKSPADKFREQMEKAQKALDSEQISQEEFDAFRNKLENDMLEKNRDLDKYQEKFNKQKDTTSSKSEPSKSMEAGSTDLYLAQVKNSTAQYQKQIQMTTDGMYNAQLDALDETRMTNYYLSELVSSGSQTNYPVWG